MTDLVRFGGTSGFVIDADMQVVPQCGSCNEPLFTTGFWEASFGRPATCGARVAGLPSTWSKSCWRANIYKTHPCYVPPLEIEEEP